MILIVILSFPARHREYVANTTDTRRFRNAGEQLRSGFDEGTNPERYGDRGYNRLEYNCQSFRLYEYYTSVLVRFSY